MARMKTPKDAAAKPAEADVDVEGHALTSRIVEGEEDVEGHSMLPDPASARLLAQARERDIQRSLRRHELEIEGRRPFKRDGR